MFVVHRELAVGRGSTAPLKNAALPSVLTTDPWDGKDGQVCMIHSYNAIYVDCTMYAIL